MYGRQLVHVSKKWLLHEADRVEAAAKDALTTRALLGTADRYTAEIDTAQQMRAIAARVSATVGDAGLRDVGCGT
ncbi:hypothetical protein [Burkholderia cepacia]|uniref:hypothetical protein n=1 Tax=Burkholderia cepacia TaxID=292 RepID=UPI002AB73422|nr:hypothetical protein [Burkholderia cepacia]